MCVACSEFVKARLNIKEFKSALLEITRNDNDQQHFREIENLMDSTSTPEELREKVADLNQLRMK